MNKATRYLIYSQLGFIAGLTACAIIRPDIILHNLALSHFGTLKTTIVPFGLGILTAVFFLLKASRTIGHSRPIEKRLSRLFIIMSVLLVGILITPFTYSKAFFYIHITFASLLWLVELRAAIWLVSKVRKDLLSQSLLALQISGLILVIISSSYLAVIHLHALGQLTTALAFSVLLMRTVVKIEEPNSN